jgi:hypothetical protein
VPAAVATLGPLLLLLLLLLLLPLPLSLPPLLSLLPLLVAVAGSVPCRTAWHRAVSARRPLRSASMQSARAPPCNAGAGDRAQNAKSAT